MNKLFISNIKAENNRYRIRIVREKDLIDLFNIYSNKENIIYLNKDDCNGDDFYYESIDKLEKKYLFWKEAYKNKWFVRYSIIDKVNKKVIGMLELMPIKSYDSFNESILFRLDLLLKYEKEEFISEIITLCKKNILKNCKYRKIIIKCDPKMNERYNSLISLKFKQSKRLYIGAEDNKQYKNYYVLKK